MLRLLGALSLATDLAAGAPLETSLRTSVLATSLARRLGVADIAEVRWVALLRHLGCTAYAHEAARITGGDDQGFLAHFAGVDPKRLSSVASRTAKLGVGSLLRAARNPKSGEQLMVAQCSQAVALAEDLGLPPGVVAGLGQIYERADGRGPYALAEIRESAQLLHVAEVVEIHHRMSGRDVVLDELRRRRGKQLAARVVDAFLADPPWSVLEAPSVWERFVDADDAVIDLEAVAVAFGRFADLKSPNTLGHSAGVAELAFAALPQPRLRIAALLHDLGSVSVPNGIWDKPGALNAVELDRVRLHAQQTEQILRHVPELADVAAIAGAHHERLDGSGYHRNAIASMLDREARILAVADAYQAMRETRAHRPPRATAQIADELAREARDGKLCPQAVDAVLGAAGHPTVRSNLQSGRTAPASLTPREIDVLVRVARGLTSKEIAAELGITVRTTNHHIENIYAKIGVTTRAAAALFAVRNDLVAPG